MRKFLLIGLIAAIIAASGCVQQPTETPKGNQGVLDDKCAGIEDYTFCNSDAECIAMDYTNIVEYYGGSSMSGPSKMSVCCVKSVSKEYLDCWWKSVVTSTPQNTDCIRFSDGKYCEADQSKQAACIENRCQLIEPRS